MILNFNKNSLFEKKLPEIIFYVALAMNFFVYFLNALIPIMVSGNNASIYTDFYGVFMKYAENFVGDPDSLYDKISYGSSFEAYAFRNLPSLILYLLPFYFINSSNAFNLFSYSLFIFYFNLGNCYIIHKITKTNYFKKLKTIHFIKNPKILCAGYLFMTFHVLEYQFGQTHAIASFFCMLGLYFMLVEREPLAFMAWSISTIFKMNPIIWIFFLIFNKSWKKFLKNSIYAIIPQIPNLLMFLLFPRLLINFFPSNLHFSTNTAPLFLRVSGTFSRELSYLLNIEISALSIIFLAIFVPITLIVLYLGKLEKIDRIMLSMLATIAILPDFWTAHVLYFAPIYLIWISNRSKWISWKIKIIPFLPTMLSTPWFIFPTISLFYFIPFLLILIVGVKTAEIHKIISAFLLKKQIDQ